MAFHVRKSTAKIIPHFRNGMSFLGSLEMGFLNSYSTHLRNTSFAAHKIGTRVLGSENIPTHLSARRFESIKVGKQVASVNDDRDNQVEYTLIQSTLILSSNFIFRILSFLFIIPDRF